MDREQIGAALDWVWRLEELTAYPLEHPAAWQQVKAIAWGLRRGNVLGEAHDLAVLVSEAVDRATGAAADAQDRERANLRDCVGRLKSELEAKLKNAG